MSEDNDESKKVIPDFSETEDPSDEAVFGTGGPAFLDPVRSQAIGYVEDDFSKPDFTHWDDTQEPLPQVNKPVLKPRHKEAARLHALGWTNNAICEKLGYSTSWISTLLANPVIKREVDRYRNKLYEKDLTSALKELGQEGLEVIELMLRSEKESMKNRVDTAKWLMEKITGKPKQEMSIESNTLSTFMDTMRQMRDSGETIQDIEITGKTIEPGETKKDEVPQSGSKFDSRIDDLLKD